MLPFGKNLNKAKESVNLFTNAFQAIQSEIESGVRGAADYPDAPPLHSTLAAPTAVAGDDEAPVDRPEPSGTADAPTELEPDFEGSASAAAASVEVERLKAKLSAASAQASKLESRLAEKTELLAEKDAQIAAVLEEGESLSVRQAEQEKTIRKLRQSTREAQQAAERAEESLRVQSEERSVAKEAVGSSLAQEVARGVNLQECLDSERAVVEELRKRLSGVEDEQLRATNELAQAQAREAVALSSLREVQLENSRLAEASRWRDEGLSSQLGQLEAAFQGLG